MKPNAPSRIDPGPAVVPDGDLVRRVRRGDPSAYELVMRRFNRRLFRAARSIVTDDSEAEDVVQEAYVRAFLRIEQFSGPHGLGAWLTRITVNEALARLRRGARVVFLEDHVNQGDTVPDRDRAAARDNMASTRPGPEHLAASDELGRLLEHAIDQLPDEFRSVFMLRAVEGLNVAETAESLGIRPETVKTRFHRARTRLKKALADRVVDQLPSAFQFDGVRCDRLVAGVMARLADRFTDEP